MDRELLALIEKQRVEIDALQGAVSALYVACAAVLQTIRVDPPIAAYAERAQVDGLFSETSEKSLSVRAAMLQALASFEPPE